MLSKKMILILKNKNKRMKNSYKGKQQKKMTTFKKNQKNRILKIV